MPMRRAIVMALAIAFVASVDQGSHVSAHHTDWGRRWEVNWVPDPTVTFYAKGTGWTTSPYARLQGAAAEWYVYSAFKPSVTRWETGDPTTALAFRAGPPGYTGDPDGYDCEIDTSDPGLACVFPFGIGYPNPMRIKRVRIVVNSQFSLMGPWYYGTGSDCADSSCLNFEGVLTHEIGHGGGLYDPECSWYSGGTKLTGMYTMCPMGPPPPAPARAWESHYQRTIEADDEQSMDDLY